MADKLDRGFRRPDVRCPACGSRESLPANLMDPNDDTRRCVDCATPFVAGSEPMRPMGAGSEVRKRMGFESNPRGVPKHKELPPGTRVRVSEGSGLDSNKVGVVIPPLLDHRGIAKTTWGGEYKPFDVRRERMIRYDDGSTGTMFLSRLREDRGVLGNPPHEKMGITQMGAYLRELERKGVDLRSVLYRRASYRPTAQVEVYVAESADSADRIMREEASQPEDARHWRPAVDRAARFRSTRHESNPGRTEVKVEKTPSGSYRVAAVVGGRLVVKQYRGYTKPKAIRLFREEYLTSEGEPFYEENRGARMDPSVRSFAEARRIIGNAHEVKVGNNTKLRNHLDGIAVILHQTPIVTFHPDDSVTLNAGGYRTVTTKARMNEVLPPWLSVYQKGGDWFVSEAGLDSKIPFFDGMRVGHKLK